ncbi:S1 family peptidase [Streptomyces coffeae]|uniref:S1 family peptidase n=1 Tax=Streptomyces coffeae TaxID=621382 RepID=UPI001F3A6AB7|nr:S1 family peptidase [Streptomyces coffeae]
MLQRDELCHPDFQALAKIQASEEAGLLEKPNVVGVALGYKYTGGEKTNQKALVALVETKLDKQMLGKGELAPAKIGETPVDVQEVGIIHAGLGPDLTTNVPMFMMDGRMEMGREGEALAEREPSAITRERIAPGMAPVRPQVLTHRVRPAYGGVSIGHYKITAGTLGTCVYDAQYFPGAPPKYYVLSNNHVLANSNDAKIGDPILQPGPYDGGSATADTIAWLSRFVPIKYMQNGNVPLNYVDAAIAEGDFRDLDRRIYWAGDVKRINSAPQINTLVQKCGRTTNYTSGRVLNINATVDVNYGNGRVARFANQILTTPMSAGGDSGSLVCDLEEGAVGLLFAGSPYVTIMNPIPLVQQLLGIRVTETP